MEINNKTATFKSIDIYWQLEVSDKKSNTLRIVTDEEFAQLIDCTHVCIRHAEHDQLTFRNRITSIVDVSGIDKDIAEYLADERKKLVLISWHAGRTPGGTDVRDL